MLDHATILIAEDEPYIALALQWAVEDAGGTVLGPAATVSGALASLNENPAAAAILDVNLADGDITPVVERLFALGAPIVLQTATQLPPDIAARFPGLTVHIKPCVPERLVEQIDEMLRAKQIISAS
ncbi:MAG: response regulator [Novosphingobium sp.]